MKVTFCFTATKQKHFEAPCPGSNIPSCSPPSHVVTMLQRAAEGEGGGACWLGGGHEEAGGAAQGGAGAAGGQVGNSPLLMCSQPDNRRHIRDTY